MDGRTVEISEACESPEDRSGAAHAAPSARTKLKRGAQRADYAPGTVRAILDEALMCHVGVSLGPHPAVIPTAFAVIDDQLYLHGSTANRMFRAMRDGAEACLTFTLLDGLVLARSAFHHSVNYRSVILYGRAREVTDPQEKLRAFDALIDHIVPGRSAEVRGANTRLASWGSASAPPSSGRYRAMGRPSSSAAPTVR